MKVEVGNELSRHFKVKIASVTLKNELEILLKISEGN